MKNFRLLNADEIECRISICNQYGVGILLYKDARCDQNILDESVGPMNWQRHHLRDNANCIVSIYDNEKKMWIEKEDTGKESNTEAEKGLASDSFKRACFNWGIGRELYTAPNMFVSKKDLKTLAQDGSKWRCNDRFIVTEIQYEDRKIVFVKVINLKTNNEIVFGAPAGEQQKVTEIEEQTITEVKLKALVGRCEDEKINVEELKKLYKVKELENLNEKQYRNIFDHWEEIKKLYGV